MAWDNRERDTVLKLLAVVCEVTGTEVSDAAKTLIVQQLSVYQAKAVLLALERCAIECRFRLTLADIVQRLVDGRPGAEEAWANFPKSEEAAGLVTEEMSAAWGVAASLYGSDQVAGRMAFKEAYEREVRDARLACRPVVWRLSPGFDKSSTEAAAIEGLRRGLLTESAALQYVLPEHHERALLASGREVKALPPVDVPKLKQLHRAIEKHWQEKAEDKAP